MSREIVPKREKSVLRRVVDEVSSQMTKVRTSTDEVRRTATVSGERDGKQLSFSIKESDLGEIRMLSAFEKLPRKSDYREEVQRLYKDGHKQKEIAAMLGISQSLVSRLLHS